MNGVAKRFELRPGRKGINTFILGRKPQTHETESGGVPREDWCHVAELSANTGIPRQGVVRSLHSQKEAHAFKSSCFFLASLATDCL